MFKWLKRSREGSAPTIRDTLFGDMPLSAWSSDSAAGEPWASFRSATRLLEDRRAEDAKLVVRGIVDTPGLESRHYLEAWLALRQIGEIPPSAIAKQVLGVVVEVGLEGGLDLVAGYADLSARYYNYSGAAVIWDHPDESLDPVVTSLLTAGQRVAEAIGPWDKQRPPAPVTGQVRINMLTPMGLHFGQGPFDALASDPLGGQVVAAATDLMRQLIQKTDR